VEIKLNAIQYNKLNKAQPCFSPYFNPLNTKETTERPEETPPLQNKSNKLLNKTFLIFRWVPCKIQQLTSNIQQSTSSIQQSTSDIEQSSSNIQQSSSNI